MIIFTNYAILQGTIAIGNVSSKFPTKYIPNESDQLQRLARNLKFSMLQVYLTRE